ncbi:hypothetical protein [Thermodesulforhabdus norvegica]|uniref:Uncharacterized protein n=1 Tax=Thermodesulforhabdus norvegica TaxID=39841 RepID=A0A1I4TYU2_9BACT|nr:hypothetical protein [Thermodesulforhabdus norvegica]SFM81797.1 hypothetical protein SAMN05660836_01596 [Thermodesulforhabdus norvegica]
MAEIKSTIELAMERTRHLVMTDREKKEMEYREHLEKIPGVAQKYLDGLMKEEEVKKALEELPEAIRENAKNKLIVSILEKTDEKLATKALSLLKSLTAQKGKHHVEELEALVHHYESRLQGALEKISRDITEKLSRRKISGTAVRIIPEKSENYRRLTREFHEAFTRAKEKCIEAFGS